ncbi:hypothetical protein [Phenylobacterium sp.]|uniref:hypothetical protein n=1 Tax=Phenylobacterium sp. TaxID=1871053 RepID=UPI00391B2F98
MGKLKSLGSRLGSLPPRISRGTDAEGHSRDLEPWRAWYSWKAWEDLRQRVFLRDDYTCQCGCGTVIAEPAERIADHKDPGDKRTIETFFDDSRVQTLWKPHHDGWKQRHERRSPGLTL